jgi:hypothetical protein
MTKHEETTAQRELEAHTERRQNTMGGDTFRITERRALVRPIGPDATPQMIIISDKRCVF